MYYPGVGLILLDHIAQEFDAEDDVPRFVPSYRCEAAAESGEQIELTIGFQDSALSCQCHSTLDNHVIESDAFDQVGKIAGFAANAVRNLGKRVDQDIFQLRVHILACES